MKTFATSQILCLTGKAIHLARRAVSRHSSNSPNTAIHSRSVVLRCLKGQKNTAYRGVVTELIEMPRFRRVLGLGELPTSSTHSDILPELKP